MHVRTRGAKPITKTARVVDPSTSRRIVVDSPLPKNIARPRQKQRVAALMFGLLIAPVAAACAGADQGVSPPTTGAPPPIEVTVPTPTTTRPSPTTTTETAPAPQPFVERADANNGVVLNHDFPDPFVFSDGDTWLAYGTNAHGKNVPVFDPARLDGALIDALPNDNLGAWARRDVHRVWAPSVAKTADGRYALYYSAEESSSGLMAIGVATADDPRGPFVDNASNPLLTIADGHPSTIGGAIDGSTFIEDGQVFLVWKNDGNSGGRATNIWMQPLSSDGQKREGSPIRILGEEGHQPWEVADYTAPRPLIEGPVVTEHNGTYYLFYSANDWHSQHYGINYATSDRLDGLFQRAPGPWLTNHSDRAGPGGQEFFEDRDGQTWMAFHAWSPDAPGYDQGGRRRLVVERVDFDASIPAVVHDCP